MNKKFCALAVILVLVSGALRAQEEILDEDVGLFKIQTQIFFLSDINRIRREVEVLRCLFEDSHLLKAIGLNKESSPDLPVIDESNIRNHLPFLENILKLMKIGIYLQDQEVVITEEVWRGLEEKGKKKSCSGTTRFAWNERLKNHVKGEMFFRERFQDSSFWISEGEVSAILEKDKGVDPDLAKKILKEKKIHEATKLFMGSLLRQLPHETIFKWVK